MTAPTTDPVATAPAEIDLNDDALIAAAIGQRVERNQHILPDDPAPEPTTAPAPETPSATTPAPADPPTPETPATDSTAQPETTEAPADPAAPDPFTVLAKDAVPLAYKQSGQAKVFDGILEVPGRGAIIPADKLDEVRNFVARGQSNADAVRDLMPKVQQYEAITYTQKDADGRVTEVLHGLDAVYRIQERSAQLNASALHILNTVRQNPRQFVNDDGSTNTVAVEMLMREARVAAQEARFQSIAERTTQQQTFHARTQDAEVRQTAVPTHLSQHHADLHAEDRAVIEQNAGLYLFAVTAEQAPHYGVAEGTLMINLDALNSQVAHLKALRAKVTATETQTAAAVKAAEKAAAENARRTVTPPAPKPKPAPPVARDRDTGQFKRLDAAEIFERSLRGDAIGTPTLTE